MNKWKRFVRRNWLAALVAGSFLLTCLSLLYFKHPASPYHQRNQFVIRFEQIGTLSPGNRVQVNGLTRGQILDAKLTEDAVFVTIEVLAHTPIPKNSSFRLINSGLMGEREVCILLGSSNEFLAYGDTANGQYDEGTSGIFRKLKLAMTNLDSILQTVDTSLDSLISGSNGKRISRITSKGNSLINSTNSLIASSKSDFKKILSETQKASKILETMISDIEQKGNQGVEQIKNIKSDLDQLLNSLKTLQQDVFAFTEKAPMPIIKEEELYNQLESLSKSVKNFRKDLIKNGLKINVDIF